MSDSEEIIFANNPLIDTIKTLQQTIKNKDIQILELSEKNDLLKSEIKSFDTLLGYSPNMTFQDKIEQNEKCEKEIEEARLSLDEASLKQYDEDMEKEDKLIENALRISELQFETSELFKEMKKDIDEKDIVTYKKHKRSVYAIVDSLFSIYKGEDKFYFFDLLIDILEKQKSVYQLDNEIKNL